MKEYLNRLMEFKNLSIEEAKQMMDMIMSGQLTTAQIAGLLIALRMKKETVDEISGMAISMRLHASRICPEGQVVDIVGTGGDLSHSFNISTTSAIVTAACGVKVAKHGNRSVSSLCGSADLLEELGVNLKLSPAQVETCINEVGIGFMFAPVFHSAMKYAMPARKELGVRTVFNILGPLTNPACAEYELLGVFSPALCEVMAGVLKNLGTKHAMVVHGDGGLDEMSISGTTKISELTEDGNIRTYEIDPTKYGIKKAPLEAIKGGDPKANAVIARAILEGKEKGPRKDIVILNAAAAMITAGKVKNFDDAIKIVRQAIEGGAANNKLKELVSFTNQYNS